MVVARAKGTSVINGREMKSFGNSPCPRLVLTSSWPTRGHFDAPLSHEKEDLGILTTVAGSVPEPGLAATILPTQNDVQVWTATIDYYACLFQPVLCLPGILI